MQTEKKKREKNGKLSLTSNAITFNWNDSFIFFCFAICHLLHEMLDEYRQNGDFFHAALPSHPKATATATTTTKRHGCAVKRTGLLVFFSLLVFVVVCCRLQFSFLPNEKMERKKWLALNFIRFFFVFQIK